MVAPYSDAALRNTVKEVANYPQVRLDAVPDGKHQSYPLKAHHHSPQKQHEGVRVVHLHGLRAALQERRDVR